MKFAHILPTLATLTASALAKTSFAVWPTNGVTIGETHNLVWFSNAPERIIQLSLIRLSDDPAVYWSVVEDLAYNVATDTPGGSFRWTVSDEHEPGDGYALFVISEPASMHRVPFYRGRPGQTEDTTNFFSIKAPFNATQALEVLRAQEL